MASINLSTLKSITRAQGLKLMGVLRVEDALLSLEPNAIRLEAWQNAGLAAEMKYMLRDPKLFASFQHILPQCRSVLMFAVPYQQNPGLKVESRQGFGRVARYAWGEDYHHVLRSKLADVVTHIQKELSQPVNCRYFSDAVPLLERALAVASELGFIGRNTLLIRPGVGSFTFLAEILCDFEVDCDQAATDDSRTFKILPSNTAGEGCGSCSRCLRACPTAALNDSGVLDAGTCISYLTIEKRSNFSDWERAAIGDWIFGCDICQEVCPFNHQNVEASAVQEFCADAGAGPYLELKSLFKLRTKGEFVTRFGKTALLRAGRELLLRNACCVVANQNYQQAVEELSCAAALDTSELVRRHAGWAMLRLRRDADGLDLLRLNNRLAQVSVADLEDTI